MPTKVEKDAITGTETTGYEWDGIRELNTPLPRWWLYVFYATVLFAVVYWILFPAWPWVNGYTEGLLGYNQRDTLQQRLTEREESQMAMVGAIRDAEVDQILADADLRSFAVAGGRAAFADNCAPCHGLGGAGQAGGYPSLADDDWLWGGTPTDIYTTLLYGIRHDHADTRWSEMPAYGRDGLLSREEIRDVADYVLSFTGGEAAPEVLARGAEIYAIQCAACHGEAGGGDRSLGAPALNDAIWLYGGERSEVIAQISHPLQGVMPAWGTRLDPATIKMLAVYVHGLGGGE
ncbi:MAG: cytochrome-c oxidase, cbb3-type subunit III [Inquilinaceae bacterium]